jgi:hypothetical protein
MAIDEGYVRNCLARSPAGSKGRPPAVCHEFGHQGLREQRHDWVDVSRIPDDGHAASYVGTDGHPR